MALDRCRGPATGYQPKGSPNTWTSQPGGAFRKSGHPRPTSDQRVQHGRPQQTHVADIQGNKCVEVFPFSWSCTSRARGGRPARRSWVAGTRVGAITDLVRPRRRDRYLLAPEATSSRDDPEREGSPTTSPAGRLPQRYQGCLRRRARGSARRGTSVLSGAPAPSRRGVPPGGSAHTAVSGTYRAPRCGSSSPTVRVRGIQSRGPGQWGTRTAGTAPKE